MATAPTPPPKRPLIIWFTQTLIALLLTVFVSFLVSAGPLSAALIHEGVTLQNLHLLLLVHGVLVVLLALLSMGLALRQRWAWPASVIFAALLVAFVVSWRFRPWFIRDVLPLVHEDPLRGSVVTNIALSLILLWYPLRLISSREVRRFFLTPRAARAAR